MLTSLPSPCMGVCALDEAGTHCAGCLRTLDEIGEWPSASLARQQEILTQLKQRRKQAGRIGNADRRHLGRRNKGAAT